MSYITNKKVLHNYEVLEKFEAGVELLGFEVKSVKNNQGSLDAAFVKIYGGEAYLVNAFIPPYQPNNTPKNYDARRHRRLLLTKKEIAALQGQGSRKGLTIIPLSVYSKGRRIKVSIALARGKKEFDKRETIKKREAERDIRRTLKYD